MATILRITDLDLNAFEPLRQESLRAGFDFVDRLCQEWTSGANRFNAPGEALFIATDNQDMVGVCGLNRDPYLDDPTVGRVRHLYVLAEHRRHGIGRALLDTVISQRAPPSASSASAPKPQTTSIPRADLNALSIRTPPTFLTFTTGPRPNMKRDKGAI